MEIDFFILDVIMMVRKFKISIHRNSFFLELSKFNLMRCNFTSFSNFLKLKKKLAPTYNSGSKVKAKLPVGRFFDAVGNSSVFFHSKSGFSLKGCVSPNQNCCGSMKILKKMKRCIYRNILCSAMDLNENSGAILYLRLILPQFKNDQKSNLPSFA